jgi:hypothetical protein
VGTARCRCATAPIERKVVHLRVKKRWGPARIAGRLALVPATVHKVLTRHRVPRLAHLDRATGRPTRRYEKTTRASWSTSTSRSWATSPMAVAGGHMAARSAGATAEPAPDSARTATR